MEHISVEEEEQDWEITADGLYMATRVLLLRRGYCCANKCRNCPYINWRDNSEWQPAPHECVHQTRVSPKAIAGAQALLAYHVQHIHEGSETEREQHNIMARHYSFLLEMWSETERMGDY